MHAAAIDPLAAHGLLDKMKHELPFYLAAAQGFTVDHSDVKEFTAKVLKWWACADKYFRPYVHVFVCPRIRERIARS